VAIQLLGKRGTSHAEDELPARKKHGAADPTQQSALRVHHTVVESALLSVWVRLPEEWEPVAAVAHDWTNEALNLRYSVPGQEKVLWDVYMVSLSIAKTAPDPSAYRVGVCMGDGREQGIMIAIINRCQNRAGYDFSTVEIKWLTTRSHNLCPDIEGRFTGVGRSLVEHARSLAKEEGIAYLVVSPLGRARGFYERCGFMDIGDFGARYNLHDLRGGSMAAFAEPSTPEMSITHS